MERAIFLARVREAAHAGRAYRVATRDVPPGTGYVGGGDDLCAHFAAEIDAVGGEAVIVNSHEDARAALGELLERYAAKSALCWQHPVLDRIGLPAFLATRDITIATAATLAEQSLADRRVTALACDIGITSVVRAIAETGTLVMHSDPGQERIASLVPPVHVAIVEQSQLVPDLFDLFAEMERRSDRGLPSNITFITGPSKTGDIELQLTTGVHGPKHWHVIVIRNS